MTLRKAYLYLFYKLYRFYENSLSVWMSDWKATLSLLVLEIWFLLSCIVYYKVFFKKDLVSDNNWPILGIGAVMVLSLSKYLVFEHRDRWKSYVAEFDQWPKKKNRIGALIVWGIILLIIANLIFSFYLMSQIDWKQYN